MKLFDDLIDAVDGELSRHSVREYRAEDCVPWKDEGENVLVLMRECAYELGGEGCGYAATLVTDDESRAPYSSVNVVGDDLGELTADAPFARIAVVVTEKIDEDDDGAYKTVQNADFVKYRVHPQGYMLRISSESGRERVRVARGALKEGINFAGVGRLYADGYLAARHVKAVRLIFVTGEAARNRVFAEAAAKSAERTSALNKIMKNMMLDCSVCSLKPVCDEVEELRELHFHANEGSGLKPRPDGNARVER